MILLALLPWLVATPLAIVGAQALRATPRRTGRAFFFFGLAVVAFAAANIAADVARSS